MHQPQGGKTVILLKQWLKLSAQVKLDAGWIERPPPRYWGWGYAFHRNAVQANIDPIYGKFPGVEESTNSGIGLALEITTAGYTDYFLQELISECSA